MAKKNAKDEQLNYKAELRLMKERGPERLYLLWGPEDYLREQYLHALKAFCLPEGEDGFSYRRLNGPELDGLAPWQRIVYIAREFYAHGAVMALYCYNGIIKDTLATE